MSALIRIERVSKSFGGGVPALREVSLQVERGDILGIAGRSGAGKSTLLRMMNLLERPDSGRVEVAGRELTALNAAELRAARRGIGMIFQGYNLLQNLSVADNVAFPLRLHGGLNPPRLRQRIVECLDLVGLADKAGSYPAQLSGGQAQRVAIARGLYTRPRVLLLDEPFSAVDALTRMKLQDLLVRVALERGLSVLLVTHDVDEAVQLSDRVVLLDRQPGPPRAVLKVGQPRPRRRGGAAAGALKREILAHFDSELAA